MMGLYRQCARALGRVVPGKRIMVTETGSTWQGGDKAAWIRYGFGALRTQLPRIRAVVWFDAKIGKQDWRAEQTTRTLNAYRRVVAMHSYQARLK